MAVAAGGRLAAAVSQAGGLGLVGGGYGNPEWLDAEFERAAGAAVGCGFITWALERSPDVLDHVLQRRPRAILLSFGDPRRIAPKVHAAGVPLLCQVQNRTDAELALEARADVIVAAARRAVTATGGERSRWCPRSPI